MSERDMLKLIKPDITITTGRPLESCEKLFSKCRGTHRQMGRNINKESKMRVPEPAGTRLGQGGTSGHGRDTIRPLKVLDDKGLNAACRSLAQAHPIFDLAHAKYGTPPLWDRTPGFATLLQIILEQQVSLASAKACFDKLAARLGDVTPAGLLALTDEGLKAAGFSRQKTAYARHLAEAVAVKHLDLERLHQMPDAEVKAELIKLKGVGEWTSDIYLVNGAA